jgi:PAS domain S-box-containing protein
MRFRIMADSAPVLIWVADTTKACTYVNEGWLRFRGRTLAEEVGSGWSLGVYPDDLQECWDTYSGSFDAHWPFRIEYRLLRHDGVYRWVLNTGTPLYGDDGSFQGYIGSCIDVTEMKESHQQLTRLVKEKEALFKELHHRVKNNLQMIIGYVTLKLSTAETPEAAGVLKQVVQRITSLALIHQQLLADENADEIDFAHFLRGLTDSMQSVEARSDIEVSLAADPVRLRVEKAMPLALLANELLSNCYRHAFPQRRQGRIDVRLQQIGEDVSLTVADDGTGFDIDVTGKGGFGLTLVDLLAGQAGGHVDIARGDGVRATVTLQG